MLTTNANYALRIRHYAQEISFNLSGQVKPSAKIIGSQVYLLVSQLSGTVVALSLKRFLVFCITGDS